MVERKAPGSPLGVCFSEHYDLLEQKDRKEFVRIFVGLICYLYGLLEMPSHLTSLRLSRTMRVVISTLIELHVLKCQLHRSMETERYHEFLHYGYSYSIAQSKPHA